MGCSIFTHMINQNKHAKAFVAGSAFPVILAPMLYLGIPSTLHPAADFNFFSHILIIPILVGLLNMFFLTFRHTLPVTGRSAYWLWGALHGLAFTLLGNFSSDIPTELFMLERPLAFITIPIAAILYACIWRFIIYNINVMMNID